MQGPADLAQASRVNHDGKLKELPNDVSELLFKLVLRLAGGLEVNDNYLKKTALEGPLQALATAIKLASSNKGSMAVVNVRDDSYNGIIALAGIPSPLASYLGGSAAVCGVVVGTVVECNTDTVVSYWPVTSDIKVSIDIISHTSKLLKYG